MNLKINCIGFSQSYRNINSINKQKYNQNNYVSFRGTRSKMVLNTSFALASILALYSCGGNDNNKIVKTNDTIQISTIPDQTDKIETKRTYHFFPKDEESISADSYDWVEEVFPDGRIEKDSLSYKISISPKGERTVAHKTYDEFGNIITTTTFPDSTKVIYKNYKTENSDETITTEKTYWSNGHLKESKFYSEHPADSTSAATIEYSIERYNENEILLYWDSNITDPERSEAHNKYDSMKRLIYDDVKNEEYTYKDKNTIPYCSTSEFEGCVRTTLYNDDGTIKEIFFKASDGTITNAKEIK